MIKMDFKNLLFPVDFLEMKYSYDINKSLTEIANKRQSWDIWFLDVDNGINFEKIDSYVGVNDSFEYVIVLWIWGSSLWAKAVIRALYSEYHNEYKKKKIYFLDNVDPDKISALLSVIDLKLSKFIVISKSGWTIETMAEYVFFWNLLKERNIENRKNNFTVIAGENSHIYLDAVNKWIEVFEVPENIGGRFSLMSYVWIIPLALYWVNVRELFNGFKDFRDTCFKKKINENPALASALIQYYSYFELWKNINVFFPYIEGFKDFWAWFVQLVWESLWKKGLWVTPMASIGVTDQHSLLQLYWNWPNDKLICFIEKETSEKDFKIDKFTFWDLLRLEKFWTEKSISEFSRLNYTMKIDKVCEYTLWELILLYEMKTAILGELFMVNTYDQPWVELWKKLTKDKLREEFGDIDLNSKL